jgi:argininosuccinate synthase
VTHSRFTQSRLHSDAVAVEFPPTIEQSNSMSENINKIVVAYSGGLDTSVLLTWLRDTYGAEVIAYCADVGQQEELDGLEEKALNTGASKCIIDDLKETFAADFIFPMIQAEAIYEGQYLLGTSIARPCISEGMVRVARENGADAIAHGATGKGNDQVRFELSTAALAPEIEMIAPWRQQRFREQFPGRAEMIEYAAEHGIPVQASAKKSYSMDRNLLHISFESGVLEDPWYDASGDDDRDMYVLSVSPEEAPDEAEYVQLLFEKGNCIGLSFDGVDEVLAQLGDVSADGSEGDYTLLTPYGVMRVLNHLGGKHGIGRIDMVENRFVGMKSRGIYETPGGTVLLAGHRQMESLTVDREVMHIRDSLIPKYAQLVYNGFWFAPEREAIQALVTESQQSVSGEVRLKLYKGNIITAGRRSVLSLYNEDVATMEGGAEHAYNQDDASGFIRLNALRLKSEASRRESERREEE